ncbi:MAG: oligosaccharide flippase family protein, partial [Bacteroidaceae bacterium]|nr:oligosaccharide flippase family protein [Bacteroidaceae bacterium]
QINNNIFSVVLGKFYQAGDVGFYNQANKWNTMGANTITGMVQGVAQPTFVQVGDDKTRLCRTFRKMLRFTCFVSFPAMFGLSLIAPEFIVILITDKWLPSANLMRILCVGGAFLPIATLYFNLIISRGKSDVYMYNIISQGVTILSSIICIYYIFGNTENVTAYILTFHLSLSKIDLMVLSYVCIVVLWIGIWHTFLRREIGLSFRHALKDILPFLIIATATMVVSYAITKPITNIYLLLVSRIIIAAIIYVGSLWLLGAKILRECVRYIMPRFPFLSRWIG